MSEEDGGAADGLLEMQARFAEQHFGAEIQGQGNAVCLVVQIYVPILKIDCLDISFN
jgi:hypothetical protein